MEPISNGDSLVSTPSDLIYTEADLSSKEDEAVSIEVGTLDTFKAFQDPWEGEDRETTINWLFIDRILRLQECILDEMLNGGVFELPDN